MKSSNGVIVAVVVLVAIVGLWQLGFLSNFGFGASQVSISGAYSPYNVSFDPTSSSQECRGLSPEFEVVSESLPKLNSSIQLSATTPIKSFCGISSPNFYFVKSSNALFNPDWLGGTRVPALTSGYGGVSQDYVVKGVGGYQSNYADFNGLECRVSNVPLACMYEPCSPVAGAFTVVGTLFVNSSEWVCVIPPITLHAGVSYPAYVQTAVGGGSQVSTLFYSFVVLNEPLSGSQLVSYTIPRETIPLALHYRTYSCPTPVGFHLEADEFPAGSVITPEQFRYNPRFFCSQFPATKINTETNFPTTDLTVYQNLVAGETPTVPSGQTWRLFYVTSDSQSRGEVAAQETISSLNASLQQQVAQIDQLTASVHDKAVLLDQLNLSLQQQAAAISQLEGQRAQQAAYISQLTQNVNEQAAIIANLSSLRDQQAQLISAMNLTVAQQAALINRLSGTISEQAALIDGLNANIAQKALIIQNLNASIAQQGAIIADLQLNLNEKIALVNQLRVTNEEQAALIAAMRLSFADQAAVIDGLQNTVQEDAVLIHNLNYSLGDEGRLLAEYRGELAEDALIIANLTQSNAEQAEIIRNMRLTNEQQGALVANLTQNNQAQAALISQLSSLNYEQGEIISGMNLSLQQSALLIQNLSAENGVQADIIAGLRLDLADEQALVASLSNSTAEQEAMLQEIQAEQSRNAGVSFCFSELGCAGGRGFVLANEQIPWVVGAIVLIGLVAYFVGRRK